MVKVIYLCDVKSCTRLAVNEILLRRDKMHVCLAHSFVSLRSPEYRKWKALQGLHKMPVHFSDHVSVGFRSPNLKIIKTFGPSSPTVL